jgi:hypothetical protein
MENFLPPPEPRADDRAQSSNTALFLCIFLLILAFFILLVSVSTHQDIKGTAVMDSLSLAFKSVLPPSPELSKFLSKDGAVLSGAPLQSQVSELFTTAIKVVQVKTVQPGKLMRIVLRSKALFLDGDTQIRPGQFALLDRIVASLSGRPPGLHYEMQFVIGSRYTSDKTLPVGQTLEMKRASAFVQEMLARGAPPDSLSIGMEPGDPEESTIWFNVRSPDEILLKPLPPEPIDLPAVPESDGAIELPAEQSP